MNTDAPYVSPAELPPHEIQRIVDMALAEDLASGDVTTRAVVPPDAIAYGRFVAREALVVCGVPVIRAVFARLDPRVVIADALSDGTRVGARTDVATITGPAHAVLAGERVALNLAQRMSGVATRTRAFVDAVPTGRSLRVADTRKTTPGLRVLERYAVRCGGGVNHRNDLGAGLLVKDNHVVLCGGVAAAIARARASAPHALRVEIEVDTLAQFDEALAHGADVVLLDNFDEAGVREAVARAAASARRPVLEVSGGVTLDRIATLAELGVDVVSIGSLTHSARAVDLALDLAVKGSW